MADKYVYTFANGETFALNSAEAVNRAAADLSLRAAALETAPAGVGVDADRLTRLEAVLGTYFGGEFADYDAARRDSRSDGKSA